MAMYQEHFGLQGKPFSIAPDPRFLYMSQRHREALAHLLYGIGEGGGFVQLTGEVGTGKTTVCRCLLGQLPDNVDVALILNPKLTAAELVASICDELHIQYPPKTKSLKPLVDVLNKHLLATHSSGRRTVLIIDEAQNLSTEVLEQVRLLTNLETSTDKLLQIILIGQPELGEVLGLHEMRQLAQRITARYHLGALSKQETRDYIQHRLRICGGSGQMFAPRAAAEVYRCTGGIPRLINILCDRALLGAYAENRSRVDTKTVRRAASEVKGSTVRSHDKGRLAVRAKGRTRLWAWAAVVLCVGGVVGFLQSDVVQQWTTPVLQAAIDDTEETVSVTAADIVPVITAEQPAAVEIVANKKESKQAVATRELESVLTSSPSGARQMARESLLARWGIERGALGSGDFCINAQRHGLRCIRGNGSWKRLSSLDRPAMLELVTSAGVQVPVVLQAFDGTMAKIELGATVLRFPKAVLDQFWKGQYTVLWRPPIQSSSLRLGDSGEDVTWLRTQLRTILDIKDAGGSPNQFDEGLREQVMRFQGIRGLAPDGVVGYRTLMHINTLTAGTKPPRLLTGGA